MTWTTSATPWAHHVYAGARDTLSLMAPKPLTALKFNRPAAMAAAAAAHVAVLTAAIPAMTDGSIAALAVVTGLTMLAIVVHGRIPRSFWAYRSAAGEVPPSPSAPSPSEPPGSVPARLAQSAACLTDRTHAGHAEWAELMARVSHELRTPLNAVLGFSDLMERGLFGPLGHHRYEEYVRHIQQSGRDLLKSAEDTLAVTSLLANPHMHTPTEVVDLDALVRDAWRFHGYRADAKPSDIRFAIPPGTEVLGDRRTLRQAMVNLLSEALARRGHDTPIEIVAEPTDDVVRFTVSVLQDAPARLPREMGSLHACLARTLLGVQGAPFDERNCETHGWCATTYLERARQPDFFMSTLI